MDAHRRELISLIARADQLVADADRCLREFNTVPEWVRAEDLREMLVEMRAWMESHVDNA